MESDGRPGNGNGLLLEVVERKISESLQLSAWLLIIPDPSGHTKQKGGYEKYPLFL